MDSRWSALSLYHTLGNVQRWVFGIETNLSDIWYSVAILTGLTVFSLMVLVRRVAAPIRV